MSNTIKILNNVHTLRVQARETQLAAMEALLGKLTVIIEDRRLEEATQKQQNAEHQAKIEALRAKLLEDGIDPAELIESAKSASVKLKRAPRPARYKYVDENGNEHVWTGQGRVPKAIAKALENGKKLEDFAV